MRQMVVVKTVSLVLGACLVMSVASASAQTQAAGQQSFVTRCARCHGTDGNGGEFGPSITSRTPSRTDADLISLFRDGLPSAGMPAIPNLEAGEATELIRYVRTLRPRNRSTPARREVTLADGRSLAGLVQNQSLTDLQLLGDDRRVHADDGCRHPGRHPQPLGYGRDATEDRPDEAGMALGADPGVEVVRDRCRREAGGLRPARAVDQRSRVMLLAGQPEADGDGRSAHHRSRRRASPSSRPRDVVTSTWV